jgi:NAD(P)-dependent dehydrogenase (short-subunit alcohol dehydrogenase family)
MGANPRKDGHKGAVLVTGASAGIGRAAALHLDAGGYLVFAGVRSEKDADSLRSKASGSLRPLQLDITRSDQIAAAAVAVAEGRDTGPGLVGLVNNAGTGRVGPLEHLPMSMVREYMEVNFMGHLAVTQALLPAIRSGRGRIINITSANARFPLPFFVPYVAAKAALTAASAALRRELMDWSIPVSVVELGFVETEIYDRGESEARKLIEDLPEESTQLYADRFLRMVEFLRKGRRRAIEASVVAALIGRILAAARPRPLYRCGPGSRMALVGAHLPGRLGDWVLAKILEGKLPSFFAGL